MRRPFPLHPEPLASKQRRRHAMFRGFAVATGLDRHPKSVTILCQRCGGIRFQGSPDSEPVAFGFCPDCIRSIH